MPEQHESGPFCVHWGEVGCCDRQCIRKGCLHPCKSHDDLLGCNVPGCPCRALLFERNGEVLQAGGG